MAAPTINLDNLLTEGTFVNFSLRVENIANGIIISIDSSESNPSNHMMGMSNNKRYAFSGTPIEIKTGVQETLGLGHLFITTEVE